MRRGLPDDRVRASAKAAVPRTAGGATPPSWHRWLLWALMLGTLPFVNPHIRSDGNSYYAYIRSIVIDHDVLFDNEYAHAEPTFQEAQNDELIRLPNGYRRNHVAVGSAVFWAPFFLAGHGAALAMQARGMAVAADGFSWPYVWACAGATALFGFLGLWWSYRLALRFAAPGAALFAVLVIWAASSLPVYLYILPFHAHAIAMFTVSWFLWNWMKVRDGHVSAGRWLVWGLSAGMMTMTYYVNGFFAIIAVIECVTRAFKPKQFVPTIVGGLWFAGGFLVGVAPDVVIKRIVEGQFLATGYAKHVFYWSDPRLWATAFSTEHGVFLWTPVLLVAGIGVVWAAARHPGIGIPLVSAAAFFFYAVAAYRNWHGHSSYGNRFLTALTPIFVVGLAALVERLVGRGSRRRWMAAASVAALFILWNAGLMFQWGTNIIPNRGLVDFREVARNQVTVVPQSISHFVARYFRDRRAAVADIERGDLPEQQRYRIKR